MMEEACQSLCFENQDCEFYTWFDTHNKVFSNYCFLFSSCDKVACNCIGCLSGPPSCAPTFDEIIPSPTKNATLVVATTTKITTSKPQQSSSSNPTTIMHSPSQTSTPTSTNSLSQVSVAGVSLTDSESSTIQSSMLGDSPLISPSPTSSLPATIQQTITPGQENLGQNEGMVTSGLVPFITESTPTLDENSEHSNHNDSNSCGNNQQLSTGVSGSNEDHPTSPQMENIGGNNDDSILNENNNETHSVENLNEENNQEVQSQFGIAGEQLTSSEINNQKNLTGNINNQELNSQNNTQQTSTSSNGSGETSSIIQNNLIDPTNTVLNMTHQENAGNNYQENNNIVINIPNLGENHGESSLINISDINEGVFSNFLGNSESSKNVSSSNPNFKTSILNYMPSLKWLFVFIDN